MSRNSVRQIIKAAVLAYLGYLALSILALSARRIDISDNRHPEGYHTYLESLSLAVTDLSAVIEEGQPYSLQLSAESGGRLEWQGDLSIAAGHSVGTLSLDGIKLRPFWRFAEPWLAFELNSGSLNLSTVYEVQWRDRLHYALAEGLLEIANLGMDALDTGALPDTGLALNALRVTGIAVDGSEQSISAKEMIADGLDLRGWSDPARAVLERVDPAVEAHTFSGVELAIDT